MENMAFAYTRGLGTLHERNYFRDSWGRYKTKLQDCGLETDIVDDAIAGKAKEDKKRTGLTENDGVLIRLLDTERRIYRGCVDHRVLIKRLDLEKTADGRSVDMRLLARRLNLKWTTRGYRICRKRKGVERKPKVVGGDVVVDFVKIEETGAGSVKVNGKLWEVVDVWQLRLDALR